MENIPQHLHPLIEAVRNHRIGFASFSYRNQEGEASKVRVNVGFNYAKMKERNLAILNEGVEFVPCPHGSYDLTAWNLAINELKVSFTSPDENRSEGQINAYMVLLNDEGQPSAIKYHYENGMLYVTALLEHKEVLQEGEYKKVKSAAKTLAKRAIEKHYLTVAKYRMYRLDRFLGRFKMNKMEFDTNGTPTYELELLED